MTFDAERRVFYFYDEDCRVLALPPPPEDAYLLELPSAEAWIVHQAIQRKLKQRADLPDTAIPRTPAWQQLQLQRDREDAVLVSAEASLHACAALMVQELTDWLKTQTSA